MAHHGEKIRFGGIGRFGFIARPGKFMRALLDAGFEFAVRALQGNFSGLPVSLHEIEGRDHPAHFIVGRPFRFAAVSSGSRLVDRAKQSFQRREHGTAIGDESAQIHQQQDRRRESHHQHYPLPGIPVYLRIRHDDAQRPDLLAPFSCIEFNRPGSGKSAGRLDAGRFSGLCDQNPVLRVDGNACHIRIGANAVENQSNAFLVQVPERWPQNTGLFLDDHFQPGAEFVPGAFDADKFVQGEKCEQRYQHQRDIDRQELDLDRPEGGRQAGRF